MFSASVLKSLSVVMTEFDVSATSFLAGLEAATLSKGASLEPATSDQTIGL